MGHVILEYVRVIARGARFSGLPIWGISAVGSALHSHCRGREFESHMLHDRTSMFVDVLFLHKMI